MCSVSRLMYTCQNFAGVYGGCSRSWPNDAVCKLGEKEDGRVLCRPEGHERIISIVSKGCVCLDAQEHTFTYEAKSPSTCTSSSNF